MTRESERSDREVEPTEAVEAVAERRRRRERGARRPIFRVGRAAAERDPGAEPADRAADPAVEGGRPRLPRLREPAEHPVHGDGVRHPARGGGRGDPPRGGPDRAPPAAGRDAVRGALHEGRRRLPEHRRGPRHVLHRGPPVPRDGLRRLLPRGRADHGRLRRPPALGQAPLPDRRDARAALPGLGRVPGRAAQARSRTACSRTTTSSGCSARYRKQRPSPRYVGTWSTMRPSETR